MWQQEKRILPGRSAVDGADVDGVGQRRPDGVEEVVGEVHPEAGVLLQLDQARQVRIGVPGNSGHFILDHCRYF